MFDRIIIVVLLISCIAGTLTYLTINALEADRLTQERTTSHEP